MVSVAVPACASKLCDPLDVTRARCHYGWRGAAVDGGRIMNATTTLRDRIVHPFVITGAVTGHRAAGGVKPRSDRTNLESTPNKGGSGDATEDAALARYRRLSLTRRGFHHDVR